MNSTLARQTATLKALHEYPEGCDLLISAFVAAANHIRRPTVCVPFPPDLFLDALGGRDYNACRATISSLPSIKRISQPGGLSSLTGDQLRFLEWLLLNARQRHKLVKVSADQFHADLRTRLNGGGVQLGDSLPTILKVDNGDAGGEDPIFSENVLTVGFHGTAAENVHSIMQNGLLNLSNTRLQRHGAAFGEGIYLGSDIATSNQFAAAAAGWKNSDLGDRIRCIFVCDVAQDNDEEMPIGYVRATRPDHVRITHVLIFNASQSVAKFKGLDWCTLVTVAYILLMLLISFRNQVSSY
ncbi:hypothetical protein BSKO_07755 [Bryopsis sp. KO-2023]|nr:hypothetical protein BSKO_07755 [Bryopsis sp. KO-2023]